MQTISRKLLFFAILIIISAALVVGLYWAYASQQWLTERSIQSIESTAHKAGGELSAYVRSLSANLLFLARHEPVRGYIRAAEHGGTDPAEGITAAGWEIHIQRNFADILRVNPSIYQVRLIGVADGGREIVRVERAGEQLRITPPSMLQQKGDRDYFVEALKLAAGQVHYSSIDLNREFGKVERPFRPTLRVMTPVYDDRGLYFGFVVINADVSRLMERYAAALNDGGQLVYVLGDKDQFLVHPEAERRYGTDLGHHFGLADQFSDETATIQRWLGSLAGSSGVDTFAAADDHYITVVKSMLSRHDEIEHYLIGIVETPMAQLKRNVWAGLLPSLGITLLLALAGIVPAWLLARLIVTPLRQLTGEAKRIAGGEWSDLLIEQLPLSRNDEIGQLSQAFVEMQEDIHRREDELSDSASRIGAIVDASSNSIITIDATGAIESVNREFGEMFGYEASEVLGQNVSMLMPSPHREQHDNYLRHHIETGEKRVIGIGRELVALRKDSSQFPCFLAVNRFSFGGNTMFVGTITDISDQRMLHDTLKASDEIRRIMESTDELFISTDEAWRIGYLNPMAMARLAVDAGPLTESDLGERVPELRRADAPFAALAEGEEAEAELWLAGLAGWFIVSCIRRRSSYYWQFVDITSLKNQQLKLEQQTLLLEHKNRELNDFAFIASHDLQEPLRKIRAFGDRLGSRYRDLLDERGQDYLARMNGAAERMSMLITDLLQLSRVSSRAGQFVPTDMAQVVAQVLEVLDQAVAERGAVVQVGRMPVIDADPAQMRQLFQNLIANALKFQLPGQAPRIDIQTVE